MYSHNWPLISWLFFRPDSGILLDGVQIAWDNIYSKYIALFCSFWQSVCFLILVALTTNMVVSLSTISTVAHSAAETFCQLFSKKYFCNSTQEIKTSLLMKLVFLVVFSNLIDFLWLFLCREWWAAVCSAVRTEDVSWYGWISPKRREAERYNWSSFSTKKWIYFLRIEGFFVMW